MPNAIVAQCTCVRVCVGVCVCVCEREDVICISVCVLRVWIVVECSMLAQVNASTCLQS